MTRADSSGRQGFRFALLGLLLLLQLGFAVPRLTQPQEYYLNWWHHNDARRLWFAVHSNDETIQDIRKVFGVARYVYDEHNQPVAVEHYCHHGTLLSAAFRIVARTFGHTEATMRSYCVAISLGSTAFLFLLVSSVLGRPLLSFLVGLTYVLLPLKFLYLDKCTYGGISELVILAAYYCLYQSRVSRVARCAFLLCFFLLFHTHWQAWLVAAGILAYLFAVRKGGGFQKLFLPAMLAAVAGAGSAIVVQYSLGLDFKELLHILVHRTAGSAESVAMTSIRWQDYLKRQELTLEGNLGESMMLVCGLVFTYLMIRRALFRNFLLKCSVLMFAVPLLWVAVFWNHSYLHATPQWFVAPGSALLLGGFLATLGDGGLLNGNAARRHVALLFVPLLLMVSIETYWEWDGVEDRNYGTREDVLAILSFDKRLVFLHPPKDKFNDDFINWWTYCEITGLYTDPVFRRSKNVGIVTPEEITRLDPQRDLLVVPNAPLVPADWLETWKKRYGLGRVTPIKKTPTVSFCEFDFDTSRSTP